MSHIKMNSTYIEDLNISAKTIKLLKKTGILKM